MYGLTRNINSYNPLRIAFHEWIDIYRDVREAPTLREKIACIFGRPGRKFEQQQSAVSAQHSA